MTKNIAIIGTGISGMIAAHLLNQKYNVQIFEANDYVGGHTATKKVTVNDKEYEIDTGFIVYNDWTYPNFIKLLNNIGVKSQATEMSFSVKNLITGLEYNGNNLNSLFAQRRNLFNPSFWRLILDIVKFNKLCKAHLEDNKDTEGVTLLDFIKAHKLSDQFTDNYILPMCAAIWSTSLESSANFPLDFFLKFFNNHGLLNIADRPQWRTIVGGSNKYIAPLIQEFEDKILLNTPVKRVSKTESGVRVFFDENGAEINREYDQVIFACHSDQALKMIEPNEHNSLSKSDYESVLGAIPYSMNEVVLHTDTSLLPKRPLAWASWNYEIGNKEQNDKPASVTYNMNILQRIESNTTFCVTLNNTNAIDENKILGKYFYSHPQFSPEMVEAQNKRENICGIDGMHFCGAYWYNGFHEDGVKSALDVCARLGAHLK